MTTHVIFDTDPGIDDAMALLYLNALPEFSLIGITTVFGNASIERCTRNALYLVERFGLDVPVFEGAGLTVTGTNDGFYPDFVHGTDGLGNIDAPEPGITAENKTAAEYLVEQARAKPGELVIIAIGRLTNLANALALDESFVRNVLEIVVMGGAVDVPGNVSDFAEANIFGDPEAAAAVYASGIPVTQVGLDVTMQTVMEQSYLDTLASTAGDAGKLIAAMTPHYLNYYHSRTGQNGIACHDSSAVSFAAFPDLYKTVRGTLTVETSGDERGRTCFAPDPKGKHQHCAEVDVPRFLDTYQKVMSGFYG